MKKLLIALCAFAGLANAAAPLVPMYESTWQSGSTYRTHPLYGINATGTPMVVYSDATYIDKGITASQPTKGTIPSHDGSWRRIASGAI